MLYSVAADFGCYRETPVLFSPIPASLDFRSFSSLLSCPLPSGQGPRCPGWRSGVPQRNRTSCWWMAWLAALTPTYGFLCEISFCFKISLKVLNVVLTFTRTILLRFIKRLSVSLQCLLKQLKNKINKPLGHYYIMVLFTKINGFLFLSFFLNNVSGFVPWLQQAVIMYLYTIRMNEIYLHKLLIHLSLPW